MLQGSAPAVNKGLANDFVCASTLIASSKKKSSVFMSFFLNSPPAKEGKCRRRGVVVLWYYKLRTNAETKKQPPSFAKATEAKARSLRSPLSFAGGQQYQRSYSTANYLIVEIGTASISVNV